ncbi:MAG: adaptor protein MecA [Clostridia bacterium]|nr:adaptor protein MecA [Clostridia bacterium]
MEFIVISENKIKVMLTEEDLRDFEIDADELDYSNTDTKRMFWDILSRAKHTAGFDTDGQRVLVQLYPSRHGGCEMFVTKIGDLSHSDEICCNQERSSPLISEKITLKSPTKSIKKSKKHFSAFCFERLEDVIAVCRQLYRTEYGDDCSAYIGDNGAYYLILSGVDTTGYTPFDKFSFIGEFGSVENYEAIRYYLCEHGKKLCPKDTVKLLSRC